MLGWTDFSEKDRISVIKYLALLQEPDTLDELGIGPVRDAFANKFFPGLNTQMTRAKYLLIVPYAFMELMGTNCTSVEKIRRRLDEIEKMSMNRFMKLDPRPSGIIGISKFQTADWLTLPPSLIYWGALRTFGIFTQDDSRGAYIRRLARQNLRKEQARNAGYQKTGDDPAVDDLLAGQEGHISCWTVSYKKDWLHDLRMELDYAEAKFLKDHILEEQPDCLFSWFLNGNSSAILNSESFFDLEKQHLPEPFASQVRLACAFSRFVFALTTIYNLIIAKNSDSALERAESQQSQYRNLSNFNLEEIFSSFGPFHAKLETFLSDCRNAMRNNDQDKLKRLVRQREIDKKGSRARCLKPGQAEKWHGGETELNFRFFRARTLVEDITAGLQNAQSQN